MTDTSTEFCERLANDCELGRWALGSTFQSGQAILDDCAQTLRSIAAERDALRAENDLLKAQIEAAREKHPAEPGLLQKQLAQKREPSINL